MRPEDQEQILTTVHDRVMHNIVAGAATTPPLPMDEVLANSVYQQQRRAKELATQTTQRTFRAPGTFHQFGFGGNALRNNKLFWGHIQQRLGRAGALEQRSLLSQVIYRYAYDVCGNFDQRVYNLARAALPPLLGALLNAASPKRLLTHWPELAPLENAVIVQGEREHVRRLHEIGTVILAPTHVSNLDPVVMAFAILQMGLPPFIYGAARDLFDNPLIGFFLHNLGSYTVDRRNNDVLYKHVLREYATLTLEYGYNNLFFPGGTRSRSGELEQHLKMGLAGTAIRAYVHNLQRQALRPKIFVVPATLSYQLVLEAETLIDDFLKDVGKSRYIITDDEFSRPWRVYDFITQLFAMDSQIYVTLGRGLDPFGNPVDEHGESLDPRGRRIDCSRYVRRDAGYDCDAARDEEYTQDLANSMRATYRRDNVIQATHVTARAIFTLLRRQQPRADVLRLIRGSTAAVAKMSEPLRDSLALREVYSEIRRLQLAVRALAAQARLRLSAAVRNLTPEDLLAEGLRHFNTYHRVPAAQRRGDRLWARDRGLLFFYQNRLAGYGLADD